MKKVALIAVNSRTSHSNPTLFAIKKVLKNDRNINPVLLELTINENWRDSLARLAETDASVYLFSVYIWNREFIEKIIPLLKAVKPQVRIILGGPEITYNIPFWKEKGWADVLVEGQAEAFIPHIFTFNDRVFESRPTPFNETTFPYEASDKELLEGRLVYYEASRGCLFNCSYCLSSCDKGKPEYRDIEKVKREMRELIALNPKIVKMVDRTFNSQVVFAREIWQFLIELNPPVPFHFEIHPVFLEEEDFRILSGAPEGLFYFEVGIQSTDKDVLKSVDRPWNRLKEKDNIDKLCQLPNIHTHLDQIVALPLDTLEKAEKSFNDIISHNPDDFQLGFLKILPGTPLASRAEEFGLSAAPFPPYEVIKTTGFSYEDLTIFYDLEADLNRYYNSDYFTGTVSFLMAQFSTPWSFFKELKNYSPENRLSKQWSVLGESLLRLGIDCFPGERDYLIDLLRYDWCPFSSGQTFPAFLRLSSDKEIKEIRKETYSLFEKRIDGFSRKGFNHSILFVPTSDRMREEREQGITLFYHGEKKKSPYTLRRNQ